MKAITYKNYGEPKDVLSLQDIPTPSPKEDEVLIEVKAVSINSWDWDFVRGIPKLYRLITGVPKPKYLVPGIDAAGIISKVGSQVSRFKEGDKVFGDLSESGFAAFAEFTTAKEKSITIMPSKMSFEEAASLSHAGNLAYQGLLAHRPIRKGDQILINGAGGCVGPFAIQIAKHYGAEVTAIDSAEKFDILNALGADHTIDYKSQNFSKNKLKYDLILDCIGTRSAGTYAKSLKQDGILSLSGGKISSMLSVGIVGRLFSLFSKKKIGMIMHRANQNNEDLIELFNQEKLKVVIDEKFPFEKLPDALLKQGEGRLKGKLVVQV